MAIQKKTSDKLLVEISSFSYKSEMPVDRSGNGGGFVFDCRALPNPGRNPELRMLSGMDEEVIALLEKDPDVLKFLDNVYNIVSQSLNNYIQRDFTHLMVSFGCTGGQHRSVYCAEWLADRILQDYEIRIEMNHLSLDELH